LTQSQPLQRVGGQIARCTIVVIGLEARKPAFACAIIAALATSTTQYKVVSTKVVFTLRLLFSFS
jgi:hypothetical protein